MSMRWMREMWTRRRAISRRGRGEATREGEGGEKKEEEKVIMA